MSPTALIPYIFLGSVAFVAIWASWTRKLEAQRDQLEDQLNWAMEEIDKTRIEANFAWGIAAHFEDKWEQNR